MDETIAEHISKISISECWEALSRSAFDAVREIVCRPNRKHQNWFREYDEGLNKLLEEKNKAKSKQLSRNTKSNKANLVEARSKL